MNGLFALIPVKDPSLGKSRLACVLNDVERFELNMALARWTLALCVRFFGGKRTLLVSDSGVMAQTARQVGAQFIAPRTNAGELNEDLAIAADHAWRAKAKGIVVIPTDLALMTESNLESALAAMPPAPGCVIVPDRYRRGTNLLAITECRVDIFSFGDGSFERHQQRAREVGCAVHVHSSEELGLDIDIPEDYAAWTAKSGRVIVPA